MLSSDPVIFTLGSYVCTSCPILYVQIISCLSHSLDSSRATIRNPIPSTCAFQVALLEAKDSLDAVTWRATKRDLAPAIKSVLALFPSLLMSRAFVYVVNFQVERKECW